MRVNRWLHRLALQAVPCRTRLTVLRALRRYAGMPPAQRQTFRLSTDLSFRQRLVLALIMVLLDQPEKLYWLILACLLFGMTHLRGIRA